MSILGMGTMGLGHRQREGRHDRAAPRQHALHAPVSPDGEGVQHQHCRQLASLPAPMFTGPFTRKPRRSLHDELLLGKTASTTN